VSTTRPTDEERQLIRQLGDHRTRRTARLRLVQLGAVDALLECLSARQEAVVWSAVQSLGELRAEAAVPRLIDLLESGRLPLDVSAALTDITGQDFGTDASRWRAWYGKPGAHPAVERLSLEACVRQAAELLGAELDGRGGRFELQLVVPGLRSQKVRIQSTPGGELDAELVLVYSECGPAIERHYEAVLRKNLTISAGAFAIRDVDGAATLVLVDRLPLATLTPRHLARSIESIAARADTVERSLTKTDER